MDAGYRSQLVFFGGGIALIKLIDMVGSLKLVVCATFLFVHTDLTVEFARVYTTISHVLRILLDDFAGAQHLAHLLKLFGGQVVHNIQDALLVRLDASLTVAGGLAVATDSLRVAAAR